MKNAHMFKILIHLDVVEDLLFYHYPKELLAYGKVSWRDFEWQFGRPDGELMIMMSSNQCLAPVALIWSSDAGREMMRTVTETSITQESATLCTGCPAGWMDATELETEHQKHIRGWYMG
jgi:hypothetical protein